MVYANENEKWSFKVKCLGRTYVEDTLKPIEELPRIIFMRYVRKSRTIERPPPPRRVGPMDQAIV